MFYRHQTIKLIIKFKGSSSKSYYLVILCRNLPNLEPLVELVAIPLFYKSYTLDPKSYFYHQILILNHKPTVAHHQHFNKYFLVISTQPYSSITPWTVRLCDFF